MKLENGTKQIPKMGGDQRDAEIRDYLTISFFKILFIRVLEFFSTNVNKEKIHLRFSFEQRFSAFSKFLSVLTKESCCYKSIRK